MGAYGSGGSIGIAGGLIESVGASESGVYLASGEGDALTMTAGAVVASGAYGSGVRVDGGTLNLGGGSVSATGAEGAGVQAAGGVVRVSGGTVSGAYGVNVMGQTDVLLSGGAFTGVEGRPTFAVSLDDPNATVAGVLAEGCAYYQLDGDDWVREGDVRFEGGTLNVPVSVRAVPIAGVE